MTHRSSLLVLVLALLTLPCAVPALGQTPPRSIPSAIIQTISPLNEAQKRELQAFAEHYVNQLAAKPDEADVATAREKLLEPLKNPGMTDVFRSAYSQVLEPRLREILERNDAIDGFNANNASQVLGMLGTNLAADTLMNHISVDNEKRPTVRIPASRDLAIALSKGDLTGGKPQQIVNALANAAQIETDWEALNTQLNSLEEIAAAKPALDANARLIEALNKTTDRIKANAAETMLMNAVYRSLVRFREAILRNMALAQQQALAPQIGDTVARVFTVAQARWDDARANSETTEALYGNAIGFAEEFLRVVRGTFMQKKDSPAESARVAWEKDDRTAFDVIVAKWVALFPPR